MREVLFLEGKLYLNTCTSTGDGDVIVMRVYSLFFHLSGSGLETSPRQHDGFTADLSQYNHSC